MGVTYIALIGIGNSSSGLQSESTFTGVGMSAAKEAKKYKASSVAIQTSLSASSTSKIGDISVANLVKGLMVGSFEDTRFKSVVKGGGSQLKSVVIVKEDAEKTKYVQILYESHSVDRVLGNTCELHGGMS